MTAPDPLPGLEACPFCGAISIGCIFRAKLRREPAAFRMFCGRCNCGTDWHETRESALAAWSRRIYPRSAANAALARENEGLREMLADALLLLENVEHRALCSFHAPSHGEHWCDCGLSNRLDAIRRALAAQTKET